MPTYLAFPAYIFTLPVAIGLVLLGCLGIPAVVYGTSSDAIWTCVNPLPTSPISAIDYQYWLEVFGYFTLIVNTTSLVIAGGLTWSDSENAHRLSDWFAISLCWLIGGGVLFQLIWFVIGALIYMGQIYYNCPSDAPIHQFGLALIVIESVASAAACLCSLAFFAN
jgi:hypothetical protein